MENQYQKKGPLADNDSKNDLKLSYLNVMPKSKSNEFTSIATTNLENQSVTTPESASFFFQKKKLIFISLVIFLLLAIAFGIYYFFNSNSKVKTEQPVNNTAPTPTVIPSTQPNNQEQAYLTWLEKTFSTNNCQDVNICGKEADPDQDGLKNTDEFNLNTDPNNNDSDNDGLADGDEFYVFLSNPMSSKTLAGSKYFDADFVKWGYNFNNDQKLGSNEIKTVQGRMQQHNLHQPTITTVGDILNFLYGFSSTKNASSTPPSLPSNIDMSVESKQDRDAQRSATIKNIGISLIKYFNENQSFPDTNNFKEMFSQIRPYVKIATKPQDPIDIDPYVYGYNLNPDKSDFVLSFYSEIAGQIIKKKKTDGEKDKLNEENALLDETRKNDLDVLRSALLLYSAKNIDPEGEKLYTFPSPDKLKTALIPDYIAALPKDPKSLKDYDYKVGANFETFTLKAILDNPKAGTTGWICNQEDECQEY